MKHFFLIIFILGLGLSTLSAQSRWRDRIELYLDQMSRKIEQIRVLAKRYNNEEALKIIQSARQDLDAAIALYQQWKSDHRRDGLLIQAREKYLSANAKADQASRLILFKPAANLLNQLERLIQQAESVAQNSDVSDANDLRYYLNKARNFQKQAKEAFSKNRYLRGHEYLKVAMYFAEKVISLSKKDVNLNDKQLRFDDYKNNIQILLNRVSSLVNDDDILQDLYNSANQYLIRATNAHSQGNNNRALLNLQVAERLTHRIVDLTEDSQDNSAERRVENDYQSLGRYLNVLRNEIESQDKENNILNKADELYTKAGQFIENKQYKQAEANLRLAQRMALRASDKISADDNLTDPGNLQNRLQEIGHLIQLQQNRLEDQKNDRAEILLGQAKDLYNQARQDYESQRFSRAYYLLNITTRILNGNENLLKRNNSENISVELISQDLNRIEQLINRLEQNTTLDETDRDRINILEKLFNKARKEYDNKNYVIAQEILTIIQNQLTHMPDK